MNISTMESVANMNDEAALLIENGKCKVAIPMLTKCLNIVQKQFEICTDGSDNNDNIDHQDNNGIMDMAAQNKNDTIRVLSSPCPLNDNNTNNNEDDFTHDTSTSRDENQCRRVSSDVLVVVEECNSRSTNAGQPLLAENGDENDDDGDFIYRHPIRLSHVPHKEEGEKYIYCLVVVYNMALAHHLIAVDAGTTKNSTTPFNDDDTCKQPIVKRLEAALRLYQLVFCMQLKGNINMDMTYALAMMNNMAQIYKVLNKTSKAQKYLNHMISSLMMMIENGEAGCIDELDGFLRNASKVILQNAHVVAAAA